MQLICHPSRETQVSAGPTTRRPRSGAAALEMALVLPLLLTLMLGIINLAWIYHVRQTMMFAAREGARELSLQGTSLSDAIALTNSYLTAANIQSATVTGQNAFSGSGNDSQARKVYIQVELASTSAILSDPFHLFSTMGPLVIKVTMRKEGELLPP